MMLCFDVIKLDIAQGYFAGTVEFCSDTYKANIQGQHRGKILRLPYEIAHGLLHITKDTRLLVRVSGAGGLYVEDRVWYGGKSEWLEIDSDVIVRYMADHQDAFDTIEIKIPDVYHTLDDN